jgi:gliding motility-associated-like protein
MKSHLLVVLSLIAFGVVRAQPVYNACSQALELCPGNSFSVNNIGANKTFCPGCEDDFSFCFTSNNTIWFKFVTNSTGGNVQVDFTNLVFENNPGQANSLQATLLSAPLPCNSASYSAIGNCESNGMGAFSLLANGLIPSTTYYLVVTGDLSGPGISLAAECTFDLLLSGSAVDRPAPAITLIPSNLSICKNEVFTATASITNCPDNDSFNWYINGVLVAQTSAPYFETSNLADGDEVLVETSCFSICPATISSSPNIVNVYSFIIDAGEDQSIVSGQSTFLNGATSAPEYTWSPSYSVSDTASLQSIVTPNQTTTYTLTATENGCTLYDYVTITVVNDFTITNTFSPNDDGINDTWEIPGAILYPNCFVQVLDRWGQLVFQSTSYSKEKAWDGRGKSGKLAEGVYFYSIELRDPDKQTFKGTITLLR